MRKQASVKAGGKQRYGLHGVVLQPIEPVTGTGVRTLNSTRLHLIMRAAVAPSILATGNWTIEGSEF
jgi:hypothetical protein